MTTVTVRIKGNDFNRGLRYARQVGGRFNPADKTWNIPADRPELGAANAYGWVIVRRDTRCPHYTRDQGCPLHGETCAAGRN